jgi:NAD(P)-dependent dehydrogenase (short-subunit alcohol dehydrogenase family)
MSTAAMAPASGRLHGRAALITGGSNGIGAEIVRLFAREGARVVFCSRSDQPGGNLAAELTAAGHEAVFIRCNVAREAEAGALVKQTADRFGGIDILINNAAVSQHASIENTSLEEWEFVLTTNLTSMFLMCRAAIPFLKQSSYPSIVNLGSTYSVVGAPGAGVYGLTKAGAASLSKTLAVELAPYGIRVNALCPGATATRLYDDFLATQPDAEATQAEVRLKHPLGRVGRPDEMAKGALYLASEDASFVTGHTLLIDGAYTAV